MTRIRNIFFAALLIPFVALADGANGQDIAGLKPAVLQVAAFVPGEGNYRYQKLETAIEQHEAQKPKNWEFLVELVKNQPDDYSKVALANLLINQIPYVDGTDGTYFPPIKGFQRGGVVCKDYAVAKYLLLKEAGYPIDKMALLIHQSVLNPENGAHVVLIVDINGELWIANQFWKGTAAKFYADNHINPAKFSKEIKKNGIDALITDFDLADNPYNKKALTKIKDYAYTDRIVLNIVNEYGVLSDKKLELLGRTKAEQQRQADIKKWKFQCKLGQGLPYRTKHTKVKHA
ncbi:hypothetical protein K6L09_21255 [Burkholderia cepacia]